MKIILKKLMKKDLIENNFISNSTTPFFSITKKDIPALFVHDANNACSNPVSSSKSLRWRETDKP